MTFPLRLCLIVSSLRLARGLLLTLRATHFATLPRRGHDPQHGVPDGIGQVRPCLDYNREIGVNCAGFVLKWAGKWARRIRRFS